MRQTERMTMAKALLCFVFVWLPLMPPVRGEGRLIIEPEGENHTQPAEQGFALFCKAGPGEGDYGNFRWMGPQGQEYTAAGAIHTFDSGSSLILSFEKPTPENSGKYACIATYANTDEVRAVVKLTFFHDISWDDCPLKQNLVIGREGTIRCLVRGNPVPTVTWLKDDIPVRNELRYEVLAPGLKVKDARPEDRGKFTVSAMVTATGKYQRKLITVDVLTPPKINDLPEVAEVTEGAPGRLHCSATGYPQPLYYWTDFPGRNLSSVVGFRVTPETGVLEITHVAREDEGEYSCHAVNPAGQDVAQIRVDVIVRPKIVLFENKTADALSEVRLECRAEGKPKPDIAIRKEGALLPLSPEDSAVFFTRRTEGFENVLQVTIRPVSRQHDGLYYCSAENKADKVERVGHLTVNFPPELVARQNPVMTWDANPATLSCHISAIPNATVEWWFRGQMVRPRPGFFTLDEAPALSILTVTDLVPDRFGIYDCKAKNKLGETILPIGLQQARRPDKPQLPHVVRVSATTVALEFQRPVDDGGMPIIEYIIRWWMEGTDETLAFNKKQGEVMGKPITIDSLMPRTKYNFKFSARSQVGEGPPSDILPVYTNEESVPDAPLILTRANFSVYPTRYDLQWAMPLSNGKEIRYFRVTYFQVDKYGPTEFRKAYSSREREIIVDTWTNLIGVELTGLKPESYYKVLVEAYNELGFSHPAEFVFQTARGDGIIGAFPDHPDPVELPHFALTMPLIIATTLLLSFMLLIFLDVICYFRFQWGLLYFLRHLLCSRGPMYTKSPIYPPA
ncbi:fasciclin-2-like [Tropilaelaps mercedesae]|uniref:Fasciclin-2-like n=1 Tax=Tropilaelaps mercedesae TaxID=418985 RepID=A0A1V9XMR7_9ACAR|nr:fasciclin-2-like [Tropilaelaps mercedesae]